MKKFTVVDHTGKQRIHLGREAISRADGVLEIYVDAYEVGVKYASGKWICVEQQECGEPDNGVYVK